jgi:hypothetical protein
VISAFSVLAIWADLSGFASLREVFLLWRRRVKFLTILKTKILVFQKDMAWEKKLAA